MARTPDLGGPYSEERRVHEVSHFRDRHCHQLEHRGDIGTVRVVIRSQSLAERFELLPAVGREQLASAFANAKSFFT